MTSRNLLTTGIIGTVIAAICCFTPLLVITLTAIGLSAIVGGVDYVLFPVMFASLGLIAYALYLRADSKGPSPKTAILAAVIVLSAAIIWIEFKYALRISIAAAVAVAAYGFFLRSPAAAKGTN